MVLFFCYFILGRSDDAVFDLSMIVAGVSIVLYYYPYGTYVAILFLWKIFSKADIGVSKKWLVLVFSFGFLALVMLSVFRGLIPPFFRRLFEDYFVRMPFGYKIRLDTMSVEYGLAILLGSIVSILLFRKLGQAERTTIFATTVMFVPIILSMNPDVFNTFSSVLWFFPTRRAWAVFYGVSLVLSFAGLQRLINRTASIDALDYSRLQYMIMAVSILLVSGVVLNVEVGSWQRPTGDDLQALEWIVDNADVDDLILNDRSYIGLFLTSMRVQNVVNEHYLLIEALGGGPGKVDQSYVNRSLAVNQIFDKPSEYDLIGPLLTEYSVTYVFLGSDPFYLDFWYAPEEDGVSVPRWKSRLDMFVSSGEYLAYFDDNPWLDVVFESGDSRVFTVLNP